MRIVFDCSGKVFIPFSDLPNSRILVCDERKTVHIFYGISVIFF